MAWKNGDACQFMKIGDDIKHWCLSDEATCFKLHGWFERITENIFPMIENYINMFHLAKANDICSSDEELISEYAELYGSFCKNVVIVHGMQPLAWNNGFQQSHVNQKEFKDEKKSYKAAHQSWAKVMFKAAKSALA